METPKRIRWAIEHRGISIREFHRRMKQRGAKGHSLPTIHGYLADRREPPLEFLEEAAEVLGVRKEWMVLGSGEPTALEQKVAAEESGGDRLSQILRKQHQSFAELPEGTHEWFLDVLSRYALGAPDGHQLTASEEGNGTLVELAGDLLLLLDLPLLKTTWGFQRRTSERQYRDYVVAQLHAISLLLPERSQGEGLGKRANSALPRLRKYIRQHL